MIVVDSSVWINHFRNLDTPQVRTLRAIRPSGIVVGDVVMLEVLRGVSDERKAAAIEERLAVYGVEPMLDPQLARRGAGHYRQLRRLGITAGKMADLIIATFCIEYDHQLLHQDHDFDSFEKHLGLRVLH